MKEAGHLSQELPIKRRDWRVKRKLTLSSRGQVGGELITNNVGLKGPGAGGEGRWRGKGESSMAGPEPPDLGLAGV